MSRAKGDEAERFTCKEAIKFFKAKINLQVNRYKDFYDHRFTYALGTVFSQ